MMVSGDRGCSIRKELGLELGWSLVLGCHWFGIEFLFGVTGIVYMILQF